MSKKSVKRKPITRVEADVKQGLTSAQVEERKQNGYTNVAQNNNEKNFLQILAGNLFTFFNAILMTIALIFIGFIYSCNNECNDGYNSGSPQYEGHT